MASLQQYANKEAEEQWRAREAGVQEFAYKMPDQMEDADGGDRDLMDPGATPKKSDHNNEEGSTATTSKASASSSTTASAPTGVRKMV